MLPSTADLSKGAAPSLDYRFHIATGGRATLRVRLLPTYPLITGQGLHLGIAIDGTAPIPLAVTAGFDAARNDTVMTEWQRRVLANETEASAEVPSPLTPGWHTARLIAVDAGVVVDRIVFELTAQPPSYDGPAETRMP